MQSTPVKLFLFAVFAILLGLFLYFGYSYRLVREDFNVAQRELASTRAQFIQTAHTLDAHNRELEGYLAQATNENFDLSGKLAAERETNRLFEGRLRDLGASVSILQKLSQTDKELLQKYSKVYFLNENYIPSNLTVIDPQYLNDKAKPLGIHTSVKPYLEGLLADAALAGQPLLVISAYRSFGTQELLKATYAVKYGTTKANTFSADQGYSEHQLGTTIDFTTPALGVGFTKFEEASAYMWLNENAYQYGFILSYPKQNTYYQFEPWHWRFVGVALATKLHESGRSFYDLDQREIDAYLVNIFD
jgi:D-alanyl-D-alanine carboxypeptidase